MCQYKTAQELCESLDKLTLNIVPNMLLASEDIKQKQNQRTNVKVEVAVLAVPNCRMVFVDVRPH